MLFMLLLHGDEAAEAAMGPDERRAIVEEHVRFGRELGERGVNRVGEALAASSEAKIVRPGPNGAIVSDGPFAETKEQLGGFYLLDLADLDEAVELAKQVPASPGLVVEVRPVSAV
jgi:hypothetical protein